MQKNCNLGHPTSWTDKRNQRIFEIYGMPLPSLSNSVKALKTTFHEIYVL